MFFLKNRDLYSVIRLFNRGYPNMGIWLSRFLPALLHRKRFYSSVLRFPIPFNTNPLSLAGLLCVSTANLTRQVFRMSFFQGVFRHLTFPGHIKNMLRNG